VLVVDDAADAAASTAKVLQLAGFDARVARSGEEALRVIEADAPDAVLLDIGMPGMDGWELARRVAERAGPLDRRPLLVAVTGYAAESDREQSEQAGIALHLVKPVDPVALVGLLRRFGRLLDTAAPG
jgi:CheY-like chemotaxis protein